MVKLEWVLIAFGVLTGVITVTRSVELHVSPASLMAVSVSHWVWEIGAKVVNVLLIPQFRQIQD
jgi:hypothetical protein